MTEKRYLKLTHQVLIDEIWSVNEGYMYQIMALIIDNFKTKLKIPGKLVDQAMVTPALFQID
jgi:hypothetical protein